MSDIFSPIQVGALSLKNRIFMAPLTRMRSRDDSDVPVLPLMAEYYRQRANAGLIISEASQISPQGKGYMGTPGIYNSASKWQHGNRLPKQYMRQMEKLRFSYGMWVECRIILYNLNQQLTCFRFGDSLCTNKTTVRGC
jgi:hypothetical protein